MTRNFAVWGGGVADPKAIERKTHIINLKRIFYGAATSGLSGSSPPASCCAARQSGLSPAIPGGFACSLMQPFAERDFE